MKKTVIIINGSGGVGKDTMCEFAADEYSTRVISAITPVKKIARLCGWDGKKDEKSRRFLSDLKALLVAFNDLPNRYLVRKTKKFLANEKHELLFVHIREISEIEKYKASLYGCRKSNDEFHIVTLLVVRNGVGRWNNESDDNVANYDYDFIYRNDMQLSDACGDFVRFLRETLDYVWNQSA